MKQFITHLSIVFFCAESFASNMMDLRSNSQIYSPKVQQSSKKEASDLISDLRKKLGTEKNNLPPNILSLINNKDLSNSTNRLSFSAVLKSFINRSAQGLSMAEKYQRPVYIESMVSLSKLKSDKKAYHNSICLQNINSDADALTTALVTLAESSRKNSSESLANSTKSLDAANSIISYIENAPQYKGKNIRKLIGDLTAVEIVDGIVREIHFSRNNLTLQFSLNMLSTLRSGNDSYYIQSLECYIDYFQEQEHLFSTRLDQLNSILDFSAVADQLKKIKEQAINNFEVLKEINTKLNGLSDNTDVMFLTKLTKFYEGNVFKNTTEEKSFLEKRVNRIRSFKDYLKAQYSNSLNVHQRLEKLTLEQQNYLVDLFLQLNGENVLTSIDSDSIFAQLKTNPNFIDQDAQIGVDYARIVTEQINKLSAYLDYEKSQLELRAKDSQILKRLVNQ